jgi:hypothetical protein
VKHDEFGAAIRGSGEKAAEEGADAADISP